jgi:hypothetical protein
MAEQPTKIELLNVIYPGLEDDVKKWMREFWTCEEISDELMTKYRLSEELSPKTVDNYRQRRFKRSIERIRLQRESYTAFIEAAGDKGLEAGAQARLWESLQAMEPRDLISLQRVLVEAAKVRVDAERVENEKAELALKLKNAEGQIVKVKDAIGGVESAEQPRAEDVVKDLRGIFGMS